MNKPLDKAKRAAAVIGAGKAVYEFSVRVDGAPVREKTQPAAIRIFGIPVFKRDEELNRTWFGFIKRGKSAVAKRHLAAGQPPDDPDIPVAG